MNIDRRHKLIGLLRCIGRYGYEKNPGAAYKALELVAYLEGWLPAQSTTSKLPAIKDPEPIIEEMLAGSEGTDNADAITDLLKSLSAPAPAVRISVLRTGDKEPGEPK